MTDAVGGETRHSPTMAVEVRRQRLLTQPELIRLVVL